MHQVSALYPVSKGSNPDSTEENVGLMRTWLTEGWSKGNVDVADNIIDTNFLVHGAGGQVINSGREGVKGLVKAWRVAFPDGVMSVLDEIPDGDKVGVRLLWTGTHLGEFYGIPPSGKKVSCLSIGIDGVKGGKIAEGWGELDMLGLMTQIGAIPPMGPPPTVDPGATDTSFSTDTSGDLEENKKVVLGFVDAINKWDLEGAKACCDLSTYVEHNPAWGAIGFDGTVQTYTMIRGALPDLTFTPDFPLVLAQADKVVVRGTVSGTHTGGPLFGVPADGKVVTWTGIDISRVTNGKITERWLCADILSLMTQLGLIPSGG